MFDRLRTWILFALKVPPEPEPPLGAPGSIRIFRAGRNYYKLRLVGWSFGQLAALVGIVVPLFFLNRVEDAVMERKTKKPNPNAAQSSTNSAASPAPATTVPLPPAHASNAPPAKAQSEGQRKKDAWKREAKAKFGKWADRFPAWLFWFLSFLEYLGIAGFLGQMVVTYAMIRLDFEMRWYIVTDRSLRIRSGTWNVQEMTMSFANLQQVMLSQGPLQRFLGIADIRVESAGGGGGLADAQHGATESMHTGIFHGVDNAPEVRDLILARLRQFRETGLGDPDEAHVPHPASTEVKGHDVLAAAREVLEETRALKARIARPT